MLFVVINQIITSGQLENDSNSHEVYATAKNMTIFFEENINRSKCLKHIIKNANIIRYDSIDIDKLSKVSHIVFKILMHDTSVNETLNTVFEIKNYIENVEMKQYEKKFQLEVVLFLISRKNKLKLRKINKFFQALAFRSYKLIYYLSLYYKIENKADEAILKYSLRNNIEMKINTECTEKIIQVFKNDILGEIFSNKKVFYESSVDETNNLMNHDNFSSNDIPLSFQGVEDGFNNNSIEVCTRPICE
ncbi:uncharacterized protein VNE69_02295 [Vairimorpha necatrix]|uniref:Uncharacterized protein n=1 Tax=Vairimorpha necatrix TaxID=6039 RepID=A0AAX4JA48_9MICR